MELAPATSDDMPKFVVFIRQNDKDIENFSIGLRNQTGDNDLADHHPYSLAMALM